VKLSEVKLSEVKLSEASASLQYVSTPNCPPLQFQKEFSCFKLFAIIVPNLSEVGQV
jgi:hypothetical protein